ncbi:MAG: nodulation protein NfeD [Syntrophobacterales bacterium]|nr:nodulation protein NfeD [Syntrophobacterales bacterium]
MSSSLLRLLLLLITALGLTGPAAAQGRYIHVAPVVGSINPGVAEFVLDCIRQAEKEQAEALILQLDTPGGLDASMRKINQAIANSRVPVVVYVSPKGARAASAGVFITIAAHVAAMAPGTNIGAAHPVAVGLGKPDKVMSEKMLNDMAAYGRALALERGRNADWVEKAVRKSVSIDAAEALRLKVIDFVAESLPDLVARLHNHTVKTAAGPRTLKTTGIPIKEIPEGLGTRILKHIADPNIAFILMLIGLAGLYFELAHPGVILPGVVGALSLLLAFYAFQTLPVNFIGVLLILLAFIFFILEIYVTSFGLLTLAGLISLALGGMMLFRGGDAEGGMAVAWNILIPSLAAITLFFLGISTLVVKSQMRRSLTGSAGLVGEHGVAYTDLTPEGRVFVHGEYWQAVSDTPVAQGQEVEVLEVIGLKLRVRPVLRGPGR